MREALALASDLTFRMRLGVPVGLVPRKARIETPMRSSPVIRGLDIGRIRLFGCDPLLEGAPMGESSSHEGPSLDFCGPDYYPGG